MEPCMMRNAGDSSAGGSHTLAASFTFAADSARIAAAAASTDAVNDEACAAGARCSPCGGPGIVKCCCAVEAAASGRGYNPPPTTAAQTAATQAARMAVVDTQQPRKYREQAVNKASEAKERPESVGASASSAAGAGEGSTNTSSGGTYCLVPPP
ncbi:MAG: hypothetical protein EOO41_04960, partial [Methanobacteriota archaeon]